MIISIWFHTHYVFYITTISYFKTDYFVTFLTHNGVSSVYTMFIHLMTYPESYCLIKLTKSESSTITNEKGYPIYNKIINSKQAEHKIQIGCIIAE